MTYCSFQLGSCTLLLSCNLCICLPTYNSAINWSVKIFFCHYSPLRAFWEVPMLGDFKWLFISDSFIIHTWHKHYSHCYLYYATFFSLYDVLNIPFSLECEKGHKYPEVWYLSVTVENVDAQWSLSALISTKGIKSELGKLAVTCSENPIVHVHLNQIQPYGTENICGCGFTYYNLLYALRFLS